MAQTNIPHLEIIQAAIERAVENGWPRLSVSLIDSVAQQESNRRHVGKDGKLTTSPAGAQGYLQIMPDVETDLTLDASDLTENIYAGVEHLAKMYKIAFDKYGLHGREADEAALTMYNFGAAAYDQALKGDRVTPPEAKKYSGEVLARLDSAETAREEIGEGEGELDQETLAQELGGAVEKPASDIPLVYRMDQREEKPSQVSEVDEYEFQGPRRSLDSYLPPLSLEDVFTSDEDKFVGPPLPKGSPPGFTKSDYELEPYKPVVDSPPGFTKSDYPLEPYEADPFVGPRRAKVVDSPPGFTKSDYPLEPYEADPDEAEAEKPSFLSRIGGAIKNNPMVASQIAQVVGGIGSGVLGGRRMAKEQAKSARRQREAMNMANAISTLTRGRTQPAVAPRPVISKPGGAETIFDILGTLGQGGAQITQGIQQREEAAEDRRRQQEMEDFRKEYLTRGQDIEQSEVERKRQADLHGGKGGGEAGFTPINRGQATLIRDTLNDLKAMHAKGWPGTTGYFSWDRKFFGPAKEQADFRNTAGMIIGPIKDVMGLGRLTREDLALVLKTLPAVDDTRSQVEGKIDGILSLVDWVEKQDRMGAPMPSEIRSKLEQHSGGATGTGAPTGTGGDYADMSEDDLQRLYDEDPNNEEVVAEMKRRI